MNSNKLRTRVKICGLSRKDDLQVAAALGADSIGFVFCEKSPRHLDLDAARELTRCVPAFVSVVALFLNPEEGLVQSVLGQVQPEILQFHGSEDAAFCEQFGRRYLKAIAMGAGAADAQEQMAAHPNACGFVLDSHAHDGIGGTGKAFDWTATPEASGRVVLAGGLNPDNVSRAIHQVNPWAVDVSSGVEDAPGIKSAAKMAAFIRAVRAADRERRVELGN